jgi:hypothetical protein
MMTFEDYRKEVSGLFSAHGKAKTISYFPVNELDLRCALQAERTISAVRKRTRSPRKPQTR